MSYSLASRMRKKLLVTVAGTVIGGLILAVIPKTSVLVGKMALLVWSGVTWIWVLLESSHPVPGWAILVVLGLLALFGLIITRLLRKELLHGMTETAGPAFQSYTEDMVDGARWRWRWVRNRITDLWCFCPICDAQLVPDGGYSETSFICERCPSDGTLWHAPRGRVVATVVGGNRHYAVNAVEREILRRIRTGERRVGT